MKLAISRKNLWDRVPMPAKSVAGFLLRVIPTRYLLGPRFMNQCRFLEEAQWWSREKSCAYQVNEIRRICLHAADKTAYYRESFAKAGFQPDKVSSPEDLRRLPTIDRGTLMDHLGSMCAVSPGSTNVDFISTAGTSGKPLQFYIGSERSSIEYAYLASGWGRVGFHAGMTMAVLRGRVIGNGNNRFPHEYDPILNQHYYSNFHLTEENLGRYLDHIRGIGPCFLHVYPSSVAQLARFILRSGMEPPRNVRGIIAESENVYPEQRKLVERVFGCRYFSSYGHTEKLVAAAECEHTNDYHVWPTYGYFELLDEGGNPVTTPGQRGEIVGTGFINTVVPFIRYRTGDYATYLGDRCGKCGREQTIIGDIRGHRIQEMLIASDGSMIPWTAVNVHDDTFDKVSRFQFYQDTPGRALLKIVPATGFGAGDASRIRRNLSKKLDGRLSFEIEMVGDIALSGRGKAIYVDQRNPGVNTGIEGNH